MTISAYCAVLRGTMLLFKSFDLGVASTSTVLDESCVCAIDQPAFNPLIRAHFPLSLVRLVSTRWGDADSSAKIMNRQSQAIWSASPIFCSCCATAKSTEAEERLHSSCSSIFRWLQHIVSTGEDLYTREICTRIFERSVSENWQWAASQSNVALAATMKVFHPVKHPHQIYSAGWVSVCGI